MEEMDEEDGQDSDEDFVKAEKPQSDGVATRVGGESEYNYLGRWCCWSKRRQTELCT